MAELYRLREGAKPPASRWLYPTDTARGLSGHARAGGHMTATEQHRHACECREWLKRIRAKRPSSVFEGQRMLNELIADIAKIRGQAAADRLRVGIEIERAKGKK